MTRHGPSTPRCALVWLLATLAAAPLLHWLVTGLPAGRTGGAGRPSVESALVAACTGAAAVGIVWLWALVTLVSLDAARGRDTDRTGLPMALRRVVLLACGVGVAGGLALPSYAATPHRPEPEAGTLSGLPLPDRATSSRWLAHLGPRPVASPAPPRDSRRVVVEPGDSLWALAEADLPPDATALEVDDRWRAIHAANRRVVGDDPDLIHPGLRLTLPPRSGSDT